jgi:uncharacterized protein YbjT (DUF2867 family)
VATAILLGAAPDSPHDGRGYEVTGPSAFTVAEAARELNATYHAETLEEAYASRATYGAPDWAVAGWVTSYAAIATGELDVVTDVVETIAGHPPMTLRQFLESRTS